MERDRTWRKVVWTNKKVHS